MTYVTLFLARGLGVMVATGPDSRPTADGGPWVCEYAPGASPLDDASARAESMLWRAIERDAPDVYREARSRGWTTPTKWTPCCGPQCCKKPGGCAFCTGKSETKAACPEVALRAVGATEVRVDLGPDVYLTYRWRDGEPDDDWDVVDNRRRYPHQVASSLTFEAAVRYAANFTAPSALRRGGAP